MATLEDKQKMLLRAYEEYADSLFRHCFFRVYDRESAKDLVQDVFFRTWEYIAKGNDIENIRAFLYRTANNSVIDYVRKKKPVSLESLQERGFDPADNSHNVGGMERIIVGRELLYALSFLEEPYRAALVMRFVDDMSPREIAAVLGETENTVSVRIHRATRKVREIWEGNRFYS